MLQIRELYPRRERILPDFSDIVHIRHTALMRQQRKRVNDLTGKALRRQVVNRHIRVLRHIVQQGDTDGILVVHLLGKMKRMENIRQPAFIELVLVRLKCDFQGLFCQMGINHHFTPFLPYTFGNQN